MGILKNMGGNIQGTNFLGGNSLGQSLIGENFPGGSFLDTVNVKPIYLNKHEFRVSLYNYGKL